MKAINISICNCGKFLDRHSWRAYKDIREIIVKRIRDELPKAKIKFQTLELPVQRKDKKEIKLVATYKAKDYQPLVVVKMTRCNLCEKEGSKYFEAVLQIRSPNEPVMERAVEYLQERVTGLRQRGLFINKIDRFDDGFDLYLTSNKLAQVLGRELLDHFGGNLKVSPRLFSKNHQTSKEIFRVSVLVELPGFGKGDYIIFNDKVYHVDKIGKKIKLINMQSGSGEIVEYAKLDYRILPRQKAYVSRTYPHLEVINPHDFQSSMVRNRPTHDYTTGQSIDVVIYKGIYVVD